MGTTVKTYGSGEVIIKEGDIGKSFFQLLEGNAAVYKNFGGDDQVKLVVLEKGQFFGEMAVIDAYPRSSTVVAEGDVRALEIPGDDINSYFTENPDKILAIMKHLGNRLKDLTNDYSEAKDLLSQLKDSGKSDALAALIRKHTAFFKARKNCKPSAEAVREADAKISGDGAKKTETYAAGTVIFKKGEPGRCMYIVHGGSVGIYSNYAEAGEIRLTELYPTSCFGEMGMIDKEDRTATAVAETNDTLVEIIYPEGLEEMFRNNPVKVDMILRHLSNRLRRLTVDYFDTCKEIAELAG